MTIKVRNKSDKHQCFANIPAFIAFEERDVSKEEAEYILQNNNFEEVKQEEPTKKNK